MLLLSRHFDLILSEIQKIIGFRITVAGNGLIVDFSFIN